MGCLDGLVAPPSPCSPGRHSSCLGGGQECKLIRVHHPWCAETCPIKEVGMSADSVADAAQQNRLHPGTRSVTTREALLSTAERLFSEQGPGNVSHREITAAARQDNVAAVDELLRSTVDLVHANVKRHTD